jgi:hypothetical protein
MRARVHRLEHRQSVDDESDTLLVVGDAETISAGCLVTADAKPYRLVAGDGSLVISPPVISC